MNKIIVMLGLLGVELFFSVSSIVGYTYTGTEDSMLYVIYCVLVAGLNLSLTLTYVLQRNTIVKYKELIVLLFPLYIGGLFVLPGLANGRFNATAITFFSYFLLWVTPAVYVAVYVNKFKLFRDMARWFEVVMLVFSTAIVATCVAPFLRGQSFVSLGGATYQTASYLAAYAFGLNLYFLFYGDNHERFSFATKKAYRGICVALLFIQFVGIILPGGRGGLVLAALYAGLVGLAYSRSRKLSHKLGLVFGVLALILVLIISFPFLMQNAVFANGFHRAFQFLTPGLGINWQGTSGRDVVYSEALNLIKQKPLFGYGLYGFWNVVEYYPHNLFLEVLLNGGLVYLTIVLFMLAAFGYKLNVMIKSDPQNRLLLYVFLYEFVMLMFSGSYMTKPVFWFSLVFVFLYNGEDNVEELADQGCSELEGA